MYTRRELAKIALGGLAAGRLLAKPNSSVRGVNIGVHSRTLRDLTLEEALPAMGAAGLSYCELWEGHVAPPRLNRKGQREWRETIAIEQFQLVDNLFNKAGIRIQAYNYDFAEDFSDRELERGFEMAKALGTSLITASAPPVIAKRLQALAAKAGMFVGLRNHDGTRADDMSTPEHLLAAIKVGPNLGICLDIGDFAAVGQDAAKFIAAHSDRIFGVYLRDRKKDRPESVAFGRGDAAVAVVLRTLESRRLKIPATIDCDSRGKDTQAEIERCYAFCRQALAAKRT